MPTNNNEISSMSYTSKDFRSLYKDVIDLAEKLTDKWSPSHSNESDPGVVLLKEAAFVGDHNNYNIDKNILENFLPSATQDKSVRSICEMNGYTPRYYVSASGDVVLYYINDSESSQTESFTIPRFTLVLTNEDGSVAYTQAEDIQVVVAANSSGSIQTTGRFIEGTLQSLIVNDSSIITLENLDDRQRIYLPETRVAQNGVFIKNVNEEDYNDYWERDNYLLTQPSGSHKFKLDYDSDMRLPYIEFPSDISNLIGDGLSISYISTSGSSGNVKAGELTTISTPSEFYDYAGHKFTTSNIQVSNMRSIVNGKDPETITEMYNSFKKIIGTFDTLISCRDYSNFIYMMTNSNDDPLVSNCYVTDRRTDYNKACNVISFNSDGTYIDNISIKPCSLTFIGVLDGIPAQGNVGELFVVGSELLVFITPTTVMSANKINLNDFTILTEAMTHYDLVIYALKAYMASEYNSKEGYQSIAYNNSFKPVTSGRMEEIKDGLADTSCISHTFKDVANDEIYYFRNLMPLKINITPYARISDRAVGADIINSVIKTISEQFNPRSLEFGSDLDISEVKQALLNCDNRIKDIDITTIAETSISDYTLPIKADGSALTMDTSVVLNMIAKNTLAGRICMFEFNDDFKIEFGQSDGRIFKNVIELNTEIPLKVSKAVGETTTEATTKTSTTTINLLSADYAYILDAPNLCAPDQEYIPPRERQRLNITTTGELKSGIYKLSEQSRTSKKLYDKLTLINRDTGMKTVYQASDTITYKIEVSDVELENDISTDYHSVGGGLLTITSQEVITNLDSLTPNISYTLKENEHLQIIYPNFYSDKTYGMYVNYRFIGDSTSKIYANEEHCLGANEVLVLNYTKEGATKTDVYTAGQYVSSSFDIKVTDSITASSVRKTWTDINGNEHQDEKFFTLASNQTISTRKQMRTELNDANVKCYWLMNNANNTVDFDPNGVKLLGDTEYFIYANATLTEMVILGAGTRLIRHEGDNNNWTISDSSVAIRSITEDGLAASIPWRSMYFNAHPLTIDEMTIITLGEGNSFSISGWDREEDEWVINNEWQTVEGVIRYTTGETSAVLPKSKDFYSIKSRLDFMATSKNAQQLLFDSVDGEIINQQVVRVGQDEIKSDETGIYYILSSNNSSYQGGDIMFTNNSIDLFTYKYTPPTESTSLKLTQGGVHSYSFFYDSSLGKYVIPVYVSKAVQPITVAANASFYDYADCSSDDIQPSNSLVLDAAGTYLLTFEDIGSDQIELKVDLTGGETSTEEAIILIGDIHVCSGFNSKISVDSAINESSVKNAIKSIIKGSDRPTIKPYLIYRPDNSAMIDLDRYCNVRLDGSLVKGAFDNQQIMWDTNNVANMMTIPYIDIDRSIININSTMRDY